MKKVLLTLSLVFLASNSYAAGYQAVKSGSDYRIGEIQHVLHGSKMDKLYCLNSPEGDGRMGVGIQFKTVNCQKETALIDWTYSPYNKTLMTGLDNDICLTVKNNTIQVMTDQCRPDDKKMQWKIDQNRIYNVGLDKCLAFSSEQINVPLLLDCNNPAFTNRQQWRFTHLN